MVAVQLVLLKINALINAIHTIAILLTANLTNVMFMIAIHIVVIASKYVIGGYATQNATLVMIVAMILVGIPVTILVMIPAIIGVNL